MLDKQSIQELVKSQDPNVGMAQAFFTNDKIFDISYEAIFKKQWIFITHLSFFKDKDIFIYNLKEGYLEIKKLENGNLDIKHSISKAPCHLKVYESLVFINLSESPYSFDEFIKPLDPYIKMHGLNDGRIVYQKDFIFNASHLATIHNWKECNHCSSHGEFGHKDYVGLHGRIYCDSFGAGIGSGIQSAEFNKRLNDWKIETQKKGLFVGEYSEDTDKYFRIAERTPLPKGIMSETIDGSYSCSSLMGDFKTIGPDFGYTACGTSPYNSFVANNEFVILFLFSPVSQNRTIVRQYWVAHQDAKVDIDKMIFLWMVTSQEDSQLCEINQKGIESRFYQPGIYGKLEKSLVQYQEFYLNHLHDHLSDLS